MTADPADAGKSQQEKPAPKKTDPTPFQQFRAANPEFDLLGRIVKNLVVFLGIAAAAFAFHYVVQQFEHAGLPEAIAAVLYVMAYCAFGVDVIWFVISLLKELVKLIEELVMGSKLLFLLGLIVVLVVGVTLSNPIKSYVSAVLRLIGSLAA